MNAKNLPLFHRSSCMLNRPSKCTPSQSACTLLPGSRRRSSRPSIRKQKHLCRSETKSMETTKTGKVDMKERMEFLKKDLDNLFNDKGVDKSQYDSKVEFMDPITKYGSVQGYMFNIGMLKRVIAPSFQLHDIRQTGEYEATTRWTMVMQPTINRALGLQRFWDPQLVFTGVSIMGVNPETGKFNRHIDLWDALEPENQEYLSREGVAHVFGQLTSSTKTPDLETPNYTLLKKKKHYEVRRYEPFVVAETDMQGASSSERESSTSSPAGEGSSAFNALAGYIFGGNKQQQKMKMTMPVFTDSLGKMQFVVTTKKDPGQIPDPQTDDIKTREEAGGYFAAVVFNGVATGEVAQQKREQLQAALEKDKLDFDSEKWILARYNDPSTKPAARKNEVLIPLKSFDIWQD